MPVDSNMANKSSVHTVQTGDKFLIRPRILETISADVFTDDNPLIRGSACKRSRLTHRYNGQLFADPRTIIEELKNRKHFVCEHLSADWRIRETFLRFVM